MSQLQGLKIAIVCDWLTSVGGAEKVIFSLHKLFPKAPIYTSIFDKEKFPEFKDANVKSSYLQYLPFSKSKHQFFLPFMPSVFETFDLSDYDIVISSSHSCAKGVITKPNTLHISYCHSPMRYVWDSWQEYIEMYNMNRLFKRLAKGRLHKIRIWDYAASERVDEYLANSDFVGKRISKYYRREAETIYPPVYLDSFSYDPDVEVGDYYLAGGRLTAYKRFDLVVEAFNELGLKLKVYGTGEDMNRLKKMADKNIEFLGYVDDSSLEKLYSGAKAYLFPQIEDFGITCIEALSSGAPVIAFKKGGALEMIQDGENGVFFEEQTVKSLKKAVNKFESKKFDRFKVSQSAQRFSEERFLSEMENYITEKYKKWQKRMS